jgi:hypothetical protein
LLIEVGHGLADRLEIELVLSAEQRRNRLGAHIRRSVS